MKFCQRVAIFLFIAMCSFAQSTPVPVYAESFRQGSTRVIEEQFEAKLTPQDANLSRAYQRLALEPIVTRFP